jgi:predicted AAA+ superfamily ATPase
MAVSEHALYDIARSWSFWDGDLPGSIPRQLALPKRLSADLALVVQGVRRCGKSTLLTQLIDRYRLSAKNCAFVNFEDPRLADALTHETLEMLVRGFRERRTRAVRLYFFLDEIQHVRHWQKWLHSKLERADKDYFIVTGSNARLMSGELGSTLTGRFRKVEL